MMARFGRNILCQECGRDDKIVTQWRDKFNYHYFCERCKVQVKEKNHHQFCEGHVTCPNTGKEECGKILNMKVTVLVDGDFIEQPVTVFCFGCNQPHNVG